MGGVSKALLEMGGRPVLAHAIEPFLAEPRVAAVVIALEPRLADDPPGWLPGTDPRVRVVAGGIERSDSVRLALDAAPMDVDVVLVHDAVRPLVSRMLVSRMIDEAARGRSVTAAVPLVDTVHEVAADGRIVRTPDRERLWLAQTPQAFPAAVLREAYRKADLAGVKATDDAALVARFVGPVHVVEGERHNLKLTVAGDIKLAEALLHSR